MQTNHHHNPHAAPPAPPLPSWHPPKQDPIDALVDDNFSFEARDLRVTFFAGDSDVWALKFGGPAPFERFLQKYNKAAFENRFGQEQTDASEVKVGAAAGGWVGWGGGGSWWVLVGGWVRKTCSGWVGAGGWPAERQQHMLLICQALPPAWSSSSTSQAGRASLPTPLPPRAAAPLRCLQLQGDFATNMNQVENEVSRQAWAEDMETDAPDPRVRVAHAVHVVMRCACCAVLRRMLSPSAGAAQAALQATQLPAQAFPAPPEQLPSNDGILLPTCLSLPPAPQELRTPTKERMVGEKRSPIQGVVMGAGERSYLMRDSQIDVMSNVMGGVEDTGLSFKLTPPKNAAGFAGFGTAGGGGGTPTLTPPKALLMNQERKMNMISPLSGSSLWHADIETGKVISEWKFQKDGVDVAMKDITTENKAAQVGGAGRCACVCVWWAGGWAGGWVGMAMEFFQRPSAVCMPACLPAAGSLWPQLTPARLLSCLPPALPSSPHPPSAPAATRGQRVPGAGHQPAGQVGHARPARRGAGAGLTRGQLHRGQGLRTRHQVQVGAGAGAGVGAGAGWVGGGVGGLTAGFHLAWKVAELSSAALPTCPTPTSACPAHPPCPTPCPSPHRPALPPACSCMATSGDGYVVVGADDGKVRLYSEKTLTQAKTSIPGMGLPITNVDVTYDGGCGAQRGLGACCLSWGAGRRRQPPASQPAQFGGLARAPSLPALNCTPPPTAAWCVGGKWVLATANHYLLANSPPCCVVCVPAGKWVLATTKNYLMVLKTTYRDPASGKELCGFTNRMGANAPAPRLLRLKTGKWLLWGCLRAAAGQGRGCGCTVASSSAWGALLCRPAQPRCLPAPTEMLTHPAPCLPRLQRM